MKPAPFYLQVALPTPLHRLFDYLPIPGDSTSHYLAGTRLLVEFGRKEQVGVLVAIVDHTSVPAAKLKSIIRRLDQTPVLDTQQLEFARWMSLYYQYPLGEVLSQMMPVWLRKGKSTDEIGEIFWRLSTEGLSLCEDDFKRSPKRKRLLQQLQQSSQPIAESLLKTEFASVGKLLQEFSQQGWIKKTAPEPNSAIGSLLPSRHALNASQCSAVSDILSERGCVLLEGVTGSGKTEVYLALIEQLLSLGKQSLLLVPEIGLTPQLIARVREKFCGNIPVLHSGLSDRERYLAWKDAKDGVAPIIIGTRSAIFTPLKNPGLIIVDEEHDQSYKQQDGFRYHARDLAVLRGKRENMLVVLGSATPSLESIRNLDRKGYRLVRLDQRAGSAKPPTIRLIDLRGKRLTQPLSPVLLNHIARHLADDKQVLLFLNRRGFAPQLLCFDCGWVANCVRCDARLTYHLKRKQLVCHHCGHQQGLPQICGGCGQESIQLMGAGTERVEQSLQTHFPDTEIIRVDRDTTSRKASFQQFRDKVEAGKRQILVGTQMLAKGHHFPNVTMVGMVSVDQGLFGSDFRASEYMAQMLVQVAGRAGRGDAPGEVFIQTYHPDHPLLQSLIGNGYSHFARELLQERKLAEFPPYSRLALLNLESSKEHAGMAYLAKVHGDLSRQSSGASVFPPVPAPMEKRAGLYRAQLLLQSGSSAALHTLLEQLVQRLEADPESRKYHWSLDVDPISLF